MFYEKNDIHRFSTLKNKTFDDKKGYLTNHDQQNHLLLN